jgi:hypothetical protein
MRRLTCCKSLLVAGCLVACVQTWTAPAAAGATVDNASFKEKSDATQKYKKGKEAFDAGRFQEALDRFRESYAIVASPNSHLMVARALIKLGRRVDAYHELDLVIAEAEGTKEKGKYKDTANAARSEQQQLGSQLAFVTFDPGVSATLAGQDIPAEKWGKPIPMEPGSVEVVVRSKTGGEQKQQLVLQPGATTSVAPPAPKAAEGPAQTTAQTGPKPEPGVDGEATIRQSTLGWVAGGVGLAGMATFAIFGLVDNSTFGDLESECPNHKDCPGRLADTAESGRTYQTVANVGLGVGVVGIGTAVVLLLTSGSSSATAKVTASARSPRLVVGPSSVSVVGGF